MCKEKGKSVALAHTSTSHTRPLCIEQANHSPVSHARRLRPQPQRQAQTRRSTATFRYVRRCGATFRYTRRRTLHTGSYTLFLRVYLFLELPTREPCVVRRLSVALPVSLITGYTDPIATAETCSGRSACCGGIANLTMRTCRKRSRGNHTFGTAQDSRQVCLFHLARGHAETILAKRTTRHARARPPLRTPPLCDTSESRHLCQRTFEDSHTSHRLHHSTTQSKRHLYSNVFWNSPPTFPVGVRRRKAIGCGLSENNTLGTSPLLQA